MTEVADIVGRSPKNCGFYPACYIMGDCDHNQWQTSNCGLPIELQRARREEWLRDLAMSNARTELAETLRRIAHSGALDCLLGKDAAALRDHLIKAGGETP